MRQERDSKRYRVGRPLFALAASALDEIEMVNLATPMLEDLSRETGESGHFAVRMGDAVVVIARTSGAGAFQLTDRVGVVRPAHCTALGKIMLASLRPDQFKRFLERVELKPSTGKSITEPAVLLREIAEVRRSAIAIDDGEFNAEVRCVAVPVYNFTGDVIGALGISGPIWRMSDQVLQEPRQAGAGGRRPAVRRVRRQRRREILLKTRSSKRLDAVCDAFGVDRRGRVRKYPPAIKERLSHCRIRGNRRQDVATHPREETSHDPLQPTYSVENRRRVCRRFRAGISGDRPRAGRARSRSAIWCR